VAFALDKFANFSNCSGEQENSCSVINSILMSLIGPINYNRGNFPVHGSAPRQAVAEQNFVRVRAINIALNYVGSLSL